MRIRGSIEEKSSSNVIGWLTVTPEAGPLVIEVLHSGTSIGKTAAQSFRPDVEKVGYGDGHCGFTFKLPPMLVEVDPSEIELRLAGTEIYLSQRTGVIASVPKVEYGSGSVFILGPARSGTSVMLLALQNVLGLSGLGESHVPQIFQRMIFQFYEYAQKFAGDDGVLASKINFEEFRSYILMYLQQFYYTQFKGEAFVDKTPGLEALVGAPFIREAFPLAKIIVMKRNGIETIESYRLKFGATFTEAFNEWAACARQTEILKHTLVDTLFIDQIDLRTRPDIIADKISLFLSKRYLSDELAKFFQKSRCDVSLRESIWSKELSLQDVAWSENEKSLYRSYEQNHTSLNTTLRSGESDD